MWGENDLPQGRKMEQKPKYDRVVRQESVQNPLCQSDGDHSLLLPNLGAECWSYETVTITVFKLTVNKLNFVHNCVLPGRNQILLTGFVFLEPLYLTGMTLLRLPVQVRPVYYCKSQIFFSQSQLYQSLLPFIWKAPEGPESK